MSSISPIIPGKPVGTGGFNIVSPFGAAPVLFQHPVADGVFAYFLQSRSLLAPETVVYADHQDPDFPVTNVTRLPISEPGILKRLTGNRILFRLPPRSIAMQSTLIAVVNHNLTPNASVVLRAGSTHQVSSMSLVLPWRRRDIVESFQPQIFPYWALDVSDPGNRDGHIRIGMVMLGLPEVPGFQFRYGWNLRRLFHAERPEMKFGSPSVHPLFEQLEADWTFDPISADDADVLTELLRSLKGDAEPLLVVPSSAVKDAHFGRLISPDEQVRDVRIRMAVRFREDGPGRIAQKKDPLVYVAGVDDIDLKGGVFERNSAAIYTDSQGVLRAVAANIPRDQHYESGVRMVLVEAARINQFTYSEHLSESVWTKEGVTVDAEVLTAPAEGVAKLKEADKIVEDDQDSGHYIEREITGATDDEDQSFLLHAAPGERGWIYIQTVSKAGTVRTSWFNLSTGQWGGISVDHQVRNQSLIRAFSEIRLTFNVESGGTTPVIRFGLSTGDGITSYQGDGESGLYLWGLQHEADAHFPSTYIQTFDTQRQREREALKFPDFDGPQSMTLYLMFVERGTGWTRVDGTRLFDLGSAFLDGAQLASSCSHPGFVTPPFGGNYFAGINNGMGAAYTVHTAAGHPEARSQIGDVVEQRYCLTEAYRLEVETSINGQPGVSGTSGDDPIGPPASMWDVNTLHIGHQIDGSHTGYNGFCAIKVLRGVHSMAAMRRA